MPLALLIVVASIGTGAQPLPADLHALIERRKACDHWAGEEPYEKARARDIAAAIRGLRCGALLRNEAALRRKYAGRADLIRVLGEPTD